MNNSNVSSIVIISGRCMYGKYTESVDLFEKEEMDDGIFEIDDDNSMVNGFINSINKGEKSFVVSDYLEGDGIWFNSNKMNFDESWDELVKYYKKNYNMDFSDEDKKLVKSSKDADYVYMK